MADKSKDNHLTTEITHEGKRIVLPADPIRMGYNTAIEVLVAKKNEDEAVVRIKEIIDAYPWDGAISFMLAMQERYGWVQSVPTPGFWSNTPPDFLSVTTGYGAAAVATLTGAGTVTSLLCVDHGQGGLTSLPTLSFAGGGGSSAAATAIMCWSITAYAVTTAGTGFTTVPYITAFDNFPSTSPAYTNTQTQAGLVATHDARIIGALSGSGITATGQSVLDGGIYTSVPTIIVQNSGVLITGSAALTATMGGQVATAYVQQL